MLAGDIELVASLSTVTSEYFVSKVELNLPTNKFNKSVIINCLLSRM